MSQPEQNIDNEKDCIDAVIRWRTYMRPLQVIASNDGILIRYMDAGRMLIACEQQTASLQKQVEEQKEENERLINLLEGAFNAGAEFINECFCGECDYCKQDGEKAPTFEQWKYKALNPTR